MLKGKKLCEGESQMKAEYLKFLNLFRIYDQNQKWTRDNVPAHCTKACSILTIKGIRFSFDHPFST